MRFLILLFLPFTLFSQGLSGDSLSLEYKSIFLKIDPFMKIDSEKFKGFQADKEFQSRDYNSTITMDRSLLLKRSTLIEPASFTRSLQFNIIGREDRNPQRDAFNNNPALREATGNTAFEFGFDTGAFFCPGGQ